MKKFIPLSILVLVFSFLFCMSAFALTGVSGPYSYEVKKNGDLRITAFDWKAYGDEDVFIPKMIDGYSVTELGDLAFSDPHSFSVAVVIPDTIVSIGEKAFFDSNITTMHIPSSVKFIGEAAFAGCRNLRQFSVDSSNSRYAQIDGVLYNKIDKSLIAYPTFYDPSNFNIPEGIVSIAPYAFYHSQHGVIGLPSTLTTIGHHAFFDCIVGGIGKEDAISLGSVTSIGEYAFSQIEHLPISFSISLADSQITEIPKGAFEGFQIGMGDIELPNSLVSIGECAFANLRTYDNSDGLTDLVIPASVEIIGNGAFSKLHDIFNFVFAEDSSLKTIGDDAFWNTQIYQYNSTDKLSLPKGLETIGENAFNYEGKQYSRISEIEVPASVKKIGDNFCNRMQINIVAEEGTYAYFWAIENGFTLSHSDDTSWLTNSGDEDQPDTSWLNN